MKKLLLVALLFLSLAAVGAAVPTEEKAWLGLVATYDEHAAEGRLKVVSIHPEGPAGKAGLKEGDVISRVNGTTFRFPDWTATVAAGGPFAWAKPGDTLRLELLRAEGKKVLEIVAAAPPPAIVEEQRQFRAALAQRRGPEVLDRLARRKSLLVVRKAKDGASLTVEGQDLTADDAAALEHHFTNSRLRLLFAPLEPGGTKRLQLSIDPDTGEPAVEAVP
jgi:predicted metalloprotease with PDZ domain